MKKFLLVIILFSSICHAQDTLVFKSGERKAVKILVMGDKITYCIPPNTKKYSIEKTDLANVVTSDSSTYIINNKIHESLSNMNHGALIINAGVGASIILLTFGLFPNENSPNFLSVSPVYSSTIDYCILNKFSIGFGVAWQSILDNPNANTSIVYNVTERITRTNVAIRFLGHIDKDTAVDFYYGIRTGLSSWTDNIITDPNNPPMPTQFYSKKTLSAISIQALFGVRFYLTDFIGLHAETGIGAPYFAEGGITIRIGAQ